MAHMCAKGPQRVKYNKVIRLNNSGRITKYLNSKRENQEVTVEAHSYTTEDNTKRYKMVQDGFYQ